MSELKGGTLVRCTAEIPGLHVYLPDVQQMANPGMVLHLVSITKDEHHLTIIGNDQKPLIRHKLAFKECCKACRAGKGHHDTYNPERYFTEVVKTMTPTFPFIEAADVIQIIFRITNFWNPDVEKDRLCLHFGNTRFEVIGDALEKLRITKRTYYTTNVEDYNLADEIPWAHVGDLLNYFDTIEKTLEKVEKDIEDADVIIRKLTGAIDAKQTGKAAEEGRTLEQTNQV